jgi:hypothetical protein
LPAERKITCSMSSFLRRFTTHVPKIAARFSQRILPEGTPVRLISVEDWSSKTAENGGPIAFMLAGDLQVDGVIVAPIGSKAWGHASFTDGDARRCRWDSIRCASKLATLMCRSEAPHSEMVASHWSIIASKTPAGSPSCCTWPGTSRFRMHTKRGS